MPESEVAALSAALWPSHKLRPYQVEAAEAVLRSVREKAGRQIAVAFARQAGKDEMLAQLEACLLLPGRPAGSVVVVTPTYRPQGLIARRRLLDRLSARAATKAAKAGGFSVRTGDNTVRVGGCTCAFLTAHPSAQARGETASRLLICNEAQEINPARWDAVFDPMGAASHCTQLFSGTVWTSRTLLARQMSYLAELERKDGVRRVFKVGWEEVARYVPAYGEQVRARIAQFGRDHPFIKTEYFLEEIDDESRFFGPARRALMEGLHPRQRKGTPGRTYALLLDIAGADEADLAEVALPWGDLDRSFTRKGRDRDMTALSVVEVDLSGLDDPLVMRPRYRVVDRRIWSGTPHPQLHATLVELARNVWAARWVVVDATGVGAGLAGFLAQALPGRVVPFVFTQSSKSQLGWDFVGVVESGRYKEYAPDGEADTGLFWAQVEACKAQVGDAPGRPLRWGVEQPGVHDDLLVSAALCGVLDRLDLRPRVARGR